MHRVIAGLLAGAVFLSSPLAFAETPTAPDASVTRVIIAPPQTDLARIIKADLAAAYYGAPAESKLRREAQRLYFFYGARHFEPIWVTTDDRGSLQFSPSAEKILDVFRNAEREGLRLADYLTPDLDVGAAASDPTRLAQLEAAFSAATLRYAQDTHGGRIDPRSVSELIDVTPPQVDAAALMTQLAGSKSPDKVLLALAPKHREFLALKAQLGKLLDGKVEPQDTIPDGPVMKVGLLDPRVPLLRERLGAPPAENGIPEYYDQAMADAVLSFQQDLGLDADGVAGPATVAALNGGTAATLEDILANMERWRWMPEELGDFNVFVNIPEFRLAVMKKDEITYTTRVVVGRTTTQTPVFSDNIRHIVVNPYWNVPSSIAANEIRPNLVANPYYLQGQNMEMLYGGQVINAALYDWRTMGINNFRIRQKPGPGNALGNIKFLFPNKHDVYLHDTPSKALFARSSRALSHGCVRVQNPMEFADALLAHEPEITAAKLEGMLGPSERWVNMETHVPVHLAYFTLRAEADGTIRSFGDIYGHNEKLKALMAQ